MTNAVWMISNRQPWVEALMRGWISTKTRSGFVNLPPPDSIVFLHASQALWRWWKDLPWTKEIDVKSLPRGGVIGVARVLEVGPTWDVMPAEDKRFFELSNDDGDWSCADVQSIRFTRPEAIPFFPCKGCLVPTRKLPSGLWEAPGVDDAVRRLLGIEPRVI